MRILDIVQRSSGCFGRFCWRWWDSIGVTQGAFSSIRIQPVASIAFAKYVVLTLLVTLYGPTSCLLGGGLQ